MTSNDALQNDVEYILLHDDARRRAASDRNWLILAAVVFTIIWYITDCYLKWEVTLSVVQHIIFALPFSIILYKTFEKNGEAKKADDGTWPRSKCVSEIDWIEESEEGSYRAYRVSGPGLNSDPELGELHLSDEQIQRFVSIMRRHGHHVSLDP